MLVVCLAHCVLTHLPISVSRTLLAPELHIIGALFAQIRKDAGPFKDHPSTSLSISKDPSAASLYNKEAKWTDVDRKVGDVDGWYSKCGSMKARKTGKMDHRKRLDSITSCLKIYYIGRSRCHRIKISMQSSCPIIGTIQKLPFPKIRPTERPYLHNRERVQEPVCVVSKEREKWESEREGEIIREERGHRPSLHIKGTNAWAADKPILRILIIRCSRCFIPTKNRGIWTYDGQSENRLVFHHRFSWYGIIDQNKSCT